MEQPIITVEPLEVMDPEEYVGPSNSFEQPENLDSLQTPHEHPMPPLDPSPVDEHLATSLVSLEQPKVSTSEIAIPPNKNIRPARRIPEFIPDVDGNMWKVWPYPDVIELSTDYDTEVEELPPGAYRDGYMIENFPIEDMISPWAKWSLKWLLRVAGAAHLGRIAYQLYECWQEYVMRREPERDPNASDTDTTDEEMRKERLY